MHLLGLVLERRIDETEWNGMEWNANVTYPLLFQRDSMRCLLERVGLFFFFLQGLVSAADIDIDDKGVCMKGTETKTNGKCGGGEEAGDGESIRCPRPRTRRIISLYVYSIYVISTLYGIYFIFQIQMTPKNGRSSKTHF